MSRVLARGAGDRIMFDKVAVLEADSAVRRVSMKRTDVLGIGCTAIDEVLYVAGFPPRDGKLRVLGRSREFGGLTGTALVAAARLGAACRYVGMLGRDRDSLAVVRDLRREGVVVPRDQIWPEARPVKSSIVASVDRGTRAIFFEDPGMAGAPATISDDTIEMSRVLLVDGYGMEGTVRATQIARRVKVPVVADLEFADEEGFSDLLSLVDHLVLAAPFARRLTGIGRRSAVLRYLWSEERQVVALTDGARGCWAVVKGSKEILHIPALKVEAIDTTGCGDVFHGAYAAALAFGYPALRALRFATVAAGLKAGHRGTRSGLPGRGDVDACVAEIERATPRGVK
jgi:sugar/nucleoside kinase (ribokinase family)